MPPSHATQQSCARHPAIDTRLTCSSCETPICPQCMVMTEVGLKCPACTGKITTHLTQLSPWLLITGTSLAALFGFVYGHVYPLILNIGFIAIFGVPVLGLILCYLLGGGCGRLLHRAVQHKQGRTLFWAVTAGGLGGFFFSPLAGVLLDGLNILLMVPDLLKSGTSSQFILWRLIIHLLAASLFLRGLQSPIRF